MAMAELPKPLVHPPVEGEVDDAALGRAAREHLGKHGALQLVAELIAKLRQAQPSWWRADALRTRWSANERMRWLEQRPDLRQRITTQLTGLVPRTARKKRPEFQADLIDSALDDGDVKVEEFDAAFEPVDLVVYGPADDLWRAFRDALPWESGGEGERALVEWLLGALLAGAGPDGLARTPILTALELRGALGAKLWQEQLPLELRVKVDEARLAHERANPEQPFRAEKELELVGLDALVKAIPIADWRTVVDAAERAFGVVTTLRPEPSDGPPDGKGDARARFPESKSKIGPLPVAPSKTPSTLPPPLRAAPVVTPRGAIITPRPNPTRPPAQPPRRSPSSLADALDDMDIVDEKPTSEYEGDSPTNPDTTRVRVGRKEH
jgi:hypothetical protein